MPGVKKSGITSHTIIWPLLVSSLLSVALYISRVLGGQTFRYAFMIWNLFLAWVPLGLSFWLISRLRTNRWLSWKNLLLTGLWLVFLPNSFYMVTDFIHLKFTGEVSVLFDAVMFMTFAWNGLLLGFVSVLMVHSELKKRLSQQRIMWILVSVFFLCSFAIYLGRYLAWNTWDILVHPVGILFDVSDRIVRPASYPNTFTTTALFTIVLSTLYFVTYKLVLAIRGEHKAQS